jgi:hypothetical protein
MEFLADFFSSIFRFITVGSAYNRPLISHFGGKTTPFSIFCFYPILSPFCVPCLIVNQEIHRHKNKNEN